ncbi:30S ribosomal protein S17 [Bacteroidota bacterium]
MEDTARKTRRERVGVVTSDSMNKSIVVVVKRKVKHPIYGKFVNKSSKFMAHDEENTANTGDTVKISETRPLSKSKRWRLVEIIERAK